VAVAAVGVVAAVALVGAGAVLSFVVGTAGRSAPVDPVYRARGLMVAWEPESRGNRAR
jgi:hypothetical protein